MYPIKVSRKEIDNFLNDNVSSLDQLNNVYESQLCDYGIGSYSRKIGEVKIEIDFLDHRMVDHFIEHIIFELKNGDYIYWDYETELVNLIDKSDSNIKLKKEYSEKILKEMEKDGIILLT